MVSRVGFFVKMGQKLGKVPIKSHFQGMGGTYFCNKTIATWSHQPSKPPAPSPLGSGWVAERGWLGGDDAPSPQPPGVWLGGWEGMTKVKKGVQAEVYWGLGALSKLVWRAKLA